MSQYIRLQWITEGQRQFLHFGIIKKGIVKINLLNTMSSEFHFQHLWSMLNDEFLQFISICTAEAVNLFTLLDENESRHRWDVVLHRNLLALVNIDLK